MAVSKTDIRQAIEQLKKWTGLPIYVGWAYGHPRIYMEEGKHEGAIELSPRLPTGQLMDWIIAFSKGFEYGLKSK